jgi:phosphatidylinositol alpha-1,6-mannosyltransferase
MNILVLTPTFFPVMGGAELGIYKICRFLGKKHKVRILTPELSSKLSSAYRMEENTFDLAEFELIRYSDRLNLKNFPGIRLLKGLIPPFSLSLVCQAMQEASSFKPDAVLTFYALPCGLAGALIQRRMRIPVLLSIIGRDVPGPDIPRFWGTYVRWSIRSVERTLFISDYCRQALSEADQAADSDVIPFGVDTASYTPDLDGSPLRIKLGIPREAKILLAIQRLDPWKRVDVLIRALSIVQKKTDAYLVVGGKGPELKRLQSLAHDLGVSSRVLFTGYIPEQELPLYYALADLFVFHSTYETFCLSLLQAMAAGKPIVSVRSTAIPELIHHGENGLLVDPGDADAFARSVLELLADVDMQRRFAVESRRRARASYDWQMVGQRYESTLEQCVSNREKSF